MMGISHFLSGWLLILLTSNSCKYTSASDCFSVGDLHIEMYTTHTLLNDLNRSALNAFKRRVAYANVNFDCILS